MIKVILAMETSLILSTLLGGRTYLSHVESQVLKPRNGEVRTLTLMLYQETKTGKRSGRRTY